METEYDPSEHVRHLSAVPAEQEIDELRDNFAEVEGKIAEINKKLSVFKHGGFKLIQQDLLDARENAKEALLGDQIRTIEGIAHMRGQVRAYERLIQLETIYLNARDQLVAVRQELMNALDGNV